MFILLATVASPPSEDYAPNAEILEAKKLEMVNGGANTSRTESGKQILAGQTLAQTINTLNLYTRIYIDVPMHAWC